MSRAPLSKIEELHSRLAEFLVDALEELDPKEKGAAAVLNVARQFIKDNNVEAVDVPGSPTRKLRDRLGKFPFEPGSESSH